MNSESLERLMETLLQMRINLRQIAETFQQQTCEIREQLALVFEKERNSLEQSLVSVDEKLAECAAQLDRYRRLYASLCSMREKLTMLGAEPPPLPDPLPSDQLEGFLTWRLRTLQREGKL